MGYVGLVVRPIINLLRHNWKQLNMELSRSKSPPVLKSALQVNKQTSIDEPHREVVKTSTLSLPSDHQGDVSARWPPGDLQPGGGSGARDQHAGAVLHQAEPGGQLGVHPGGREPRLRDDAVLHAQSTSPERRRRAPRVVHHSLRQRDRWDSSLLLDFI